jgi:hypothetical protein
MAGFEGDMIRASEMIGAIAESNCAFTFELAKRLKDIAPNENIENLSVGQLIDVTYRYSTEFNRLN